MPQESPLTAEFLIKEVASQQASSYLALAPGSYTFTVNVSQDNTILPISETLKANTVTSIFTVGMVNGTPKLELVPAQASGLPALPGTGSDPNAPATSLQPLTPWLVLLGALVSVMIGTSVLTRRLVKAPFC